MTDDFDAGGDGFAGVDGELFCADDLGSDFCFFTELNVAEVAKLLDDFFFADLCRRGNFDGFVGVFRGSDGICGGVDCAEGVALSGFDDDGRGRGETGRQTGDVDAHGAVEPFTAHDAERDFASAAGADFRGFAADSRGECGLWCAEIERVVKVFFAAEIAHVGEAGDVFAVARGFENEQRIGAAAAVWLVVVFVIDTEHGESVRRRLAAGRERLNEVAKLSERVCLRCRLKIRVAAADAGIDAEAGVRAARVAPEFDDFAVAVNEVIELHLAPVLESEIVGVHRVFSAEGEPRIFHRLQDDLLVGLAVCGKDFDTGIDLRFIAGGIDIEDDLLPRHGAEAEAIDIACNTERAFDARWKWERCDGLRRQVVGLGFVGFHRLANIRGLCCERCGAGEGGLLRRNSERLGAAVHARDENPITAGLDCEHGRCRGLHRPRVALGQRWERPHFQRTILGTGDERISIGGESDSRDGALVRKAGDEQRIELGLFARNEAPQMDALVRTA